jgi:hypothetical protein
MTSRSGRRNDDLIRWPSWLALMLWSTIRGILATVLTVALFVGVLSALVLIALGRGPAEVAVPNVVNMQRDHALETMADAGLRLDLSREVYSTEVEDGHVISIRPAAGKVTRRGRNIYGIVSLGTQDVKVPKVVGHNSQSAQQRIRDAKLNVGTVQYRSDSNPRDHVLEQSPAAETLVSRSQQVNLILSGGPDYGRQEMAGGRIVVFRTAKLVVPQGEPLQRVVIKVVSTNPKFERVFYGRVHHPGDEVTADFYAPQGARLQVLMDNETLVNQKI